MNWRSPKRSGVAIMWALVIVTVLTMISATAVWQMMAGRRAIERRQNSIQALWLARSGAELAAERLLTQADYPGETVALSKYAELRVAVTKVPDAAEQYRIHCEARVPASGPGVVAQALSWTATRHGEPSRIRLELVDSDSPDSPSPQK